MMIMKCSLSNRKHKHRSPTQAVIEVSENTDKDPTEHNCYPGRNSSTKANNYNATLIICFLHIC